MAWMALLQEQGLLNMLPESGSLPSEALPGSEAASGERQRPRAGSGDGGQGRRPAPRKASGPSSSKFVAIDCEMVGMGPRGCVSELACCSVVSYHGDILYDKYIRPEMPIVDYRTRWSGITRQHMHKAIPFQVVQKEILNLLKGKPDLHTRGRVSLKDLALQLLHKRIQVGQHGHSSVEDAATVMELYQLVEDRWEQEAASSLWSHPENREPNSSTDMEHYMEDQY
ncbi:Apoptosis-enhancing nuclease [Heterocephalus glaber]|uniref:Apoptosis-enhancing nuclease n=1 Tax=Heterocephalus glaber TaxID=10181 RepID=G5AKM3_HETGA|nr:Apoptosis-enhancing nuclease [Heterocephalus glaber]